MDDSGLSADRLCAQQQLMSSPGRQTRGETRARRGTLGNTAVRGAIKRSEGSQEKRASVTPGGGGSVAEGKEEGAVDQSHCWRKRAWEGSRETNSGRTGSRNTRLGVLVACQK